MGNVLVYQDFQKPKEGGVHHRLMCISGPGKGKAFFLTGNRVLAGRSKKIDISILDNSCSREHAEFVKAGEDYVVSDLGSQNGIYVNDLKVSQKKLANGDTVIIGKTVFKYSVLTIPTGKTLIKELGSEEDPADSTEKNPAAKKKNLLFAAIGVAVFILLFTGDPSPKKEVENVEKVNPLNDLSMDLSREFTQENDLKARQSRGKINDILHQGLREFRERNYFRAMSEFNHALTLSPGDSQASFYLRKTREALDKIIREYNLSAAREKEALQYSKASVSYCAIIRLLHNYPEDERFKDAKDKLEKLETLMGLEKGEISCLQE